MCSGLEGGWGGEIGINFDYSAFGKKTGIFRHVRKLIAHKPSWKELPNDMFWQLQKVNADRE